nr:hypothetical protein GCM10020063_086720 [Dactylosporangium thailandense]
MEAAMDDRETRDGTRGEAARSGPPPGDGADLPPLPPPPPVGAELPPEPSDEELPDQAYEPPPTPVDGALWPGANPFESAGGQEEDDPELAAMMAAFGDASDAAPSSAAPAPSAPAPSASAPESAPPAAAPSSWDPFAPSSAPPRALLGCVRPTGSGALLGADLGAFCGWTAGSPRRRAELRATVSRAAALRVLLGTSGPRAAGLRALLGASRLRAVLLGASGLPAWRL